MTRLKIDITIPLYYNDGSTIHKDKLDFIRDKLIKDFGGITIINGIKGYWYNVKEYRIMTDFNIIYSVLVDNNSDNIQYFKDLKINLEEYLKQYEIFIIITEVDKL